MLGVNCVSFDT